MKGLTLRLFICLPLLFITTLGYANEAILTWVSEPTTDNTQINVRRFENEQWLTLEKIYESNELNSSPSVGSNLAGDIMVVWSSQSVIRSTIRAKMLRNGEWQNSTVVVNQAGQLTSPIIGFDGEGNAHLLWVSDQRGLDDVYHKKWISETSQWSAIQQINAENQVPDIRPEIFYDAGDMYVRWQSFSLETGEYVQEQVLLISATQDQLSQQESTKKNADESNNLTELSVSNDRSIEDIRLPDDFDYIDKAAGIHFPNNRQIKFFRLY